MIKRIVLMDPFPKERPRLSRGGAHMSKSYRDKKKMFKALFGPVDVPVDRPIGMRLVFYRKAPATWSLRKYGKQAGKWCIAGGDADNLAGGVMDSLFKEDRMIVKLDIERRWSDREDRAGYIRVEIYECR